MVDHRRIDREAGLLPEPRLEDAADPLAIPRRERDAELEPIGQDDAGDRRAAPGRRRDPEPMEVAPEAQHRAVGEAAPPGQLRAFPRPAIQVPPDPGLSLAEEGVDPRLGMGPT